MFFSNIFKKRFFKFNLKNDINSGFSLIELTISISIIIILSAILFLNYKSGQKTFALERASYRLIQDLREIQSKAGIGFEGCKNGDIFDDNYKYSYGLILADYYSYILFADCNGDNSYEESIDKKIEIVNLEKGVKIDIARCSISNPCVNYLVFIPPRPTVLINGNDLEEADIYLKIDESDNSNSSLTKNIIINKFGLIYLSNVSK
jgi:type II secretory pathway pseudopilin PulG